MAPLYRSGRCRVNASSVSYRWLSASKTGKSQPCAPWPERYGFSNSRVNSCVPDGAQPGSMGHELAGVAVPNSRVILSTTHGGVDDRSHARRPHPRGRRAHVRARPRRRCSPTGAPRSIKIEHVERGDAMRGLASSGIAVMGTDVHVLLEHSNRGKQSLGLDLTSDDGLDILYKLAATCDVFLTNKLPERPHEAEDRRRRHPGPQPEHHLRARARARASGAPTPTRAPTTRSPTGAGPASPWA